MHAFFQSKTFKVILIVAVMLFAVLLRSIALGDFFQGFTDLGEKVTEKLSQRVTNMGESVTEYWSRLTNQSDLEKENERLKEEIRQLKIKQIDYDAIKNENELYREFIEVSDANTSYDLLPCTVVARPIDDITNSFYLDEGKNSGITAGLPVINDDGLVGVVSKVGNEFCYVSTLMDPNTNIGVVISSTQDTGIVSGSLLLEKNECLLSYVSRDSKMKVGDMVVSSGYGGLIPKGLIIGTVKEIVLDDTGLSLEARIQLAANPIETKRAFIITSYEGNNSPVEDVS